jgi:hypothetical protein
MLLRRAAALWVNRVASRPAVVRPAAAAGVAAAAAAVGAAAAAQCEAAPRPAAAPTYGTWAWSSRSVGPIAPEAKEVLSHWYCRRYDGSMASGLAADADPRTACGTPPTAREEQLIKAQWVGSKSGWQTRMLSDAAASVADAGPGDGKAWWRALHERARRGELDHWQSSPWESLALVLLLDQVPRVLFNGPEILRSDSKALSVTLAAIERGADLELPPAWRIFFYFPLMHAEQVPPQELGVR